MRTNLPVTQVERPYPAGKTIVSKTDAGGVIAYANEAFVEISGYTADELIGQPHNVLRHPDVPAPVFAHMWATLSSGKPWRGIVKNRCKNGDHYWVDAYVVPLKKQNKTIGYMSVRSEPSREQIADAEKLYAEVRRSGKLPTRPLLNPLRFFSVKRGVLTGIIFVLIATAVSAWLGVSGLQKTSSLVYQLQRHNDVASMVAKANQHAANAQANILLALQHGPGGHGFWREDPLEYVQHLQLVTQAAQQLLDQTATIDDNKSIITASTKDMDDLVKGFSAKRTGNEIAISGYINASRALVNSGIHPVMEKLQRKQFAEAQSLIINVAGPLAIELNARSDDVARNIFDTSILLRRTVDDLYDATLERLIYWSAFMALVVAISGILFFRATMGPLNRAIRHMQQIADGNLSTHADVYGFGEPGKVEVAVASMQIQLQVMLDEIQSASGEVRAQVKRLNNGVIDVVNCTEDQHERATQIVGTLEGAGADVERLAAAAAEAAHLAQQIHSNLPAMDEENLKRLLDLLPTIASLASLNQLAGDEIRRLANGIMELVASNRESANDAWTVGQKLNETSQKLNGMLEKFD